MGRALGGDVMTPIEKGGETCGAAKFATAGPAPRRNSEQGAGQVAQEEEKRGNDDRRPRAPAREVAELHGEHLRNDALRAIEKQRDDLGIVQRLAEAAAALAGGDTASIFTWPASVKLTMSCGRILGQPHQPVAMLEVEGEQLRSGGMTRLHRMSDLDRAERRGHRRPHEERAHAERGARLGGEEDLRGGRGGDQPRQGEGNADPGRAQPDATDRGAPGG